jgi:catechol 2,3-dioxygenase-like lactoylglutathione lyase family enzyme
MPPLPICTPPRRLLRRGLTFWLAAVALAGAGAGASGQSASTSPAPHLRLAVAGLRIQVTDLAAAERFYTRACGFELLRRSGDGTDSLLRNGSIRLRLHKVDKPAPAHYPGDAEIHVNFEVKSLAATLKELAAAGYTSVEGSPQPTAIGTYVTITDPAGNIHQLLELTKPERPGARPTVFNLEIEVTDMKRARAFYVDQLGFQVQTEHFFPPTIPLEQKGPASLVLQETANKTVPVGYPHDSRTIIQLGTPDPAAVAGALRQGGVTFLATGGGGDAAAAFQDPFGNVFELVAAQGAPGP